jgi:cell wall assembly regulator SMI1
MFGQPSDPRYRISSPEDFVEIGMAIYGEPMGRPPQDSWYSLADVQDGNYIAIDCHPARLGLCYDIFHETASDLGNCRIIARSFSEFLQRAALSGDDAWWLGDRFEMYGYADDQSQP